MNLINDDCLVAMKNLSDGCVDSVITDPPYNLIKSTSGFERGKNSPYTRTAKGGFMGKEWDGTGIALKIDLWKEILRIAKPGAFLLCFGGTRTYHRIACAIEDAGWEIRDCIMWVYGSGFPKSLNIGKAVDKLQGNEREIVGKKQNTYDGSIRNPENHKSPAELSNIGKWGLTQTPHGMNETKGTSEWEGYGTALKPAYEPIIVAMKPLDGTFVNNALKHGVAGLNIDDCRIPINQQVDDKRLGGNGEWKTDKAAKNVYEGGYAGNNIKSSESGRFPANFIHDGSQEVLDLFPNTKTGKVVSHSSKGIWGSGKDTSYNNLETGGSVGRFFYCAKASKSERNAGLSPKKIEITRTAITEDISEYSAEELLKDMYCNNHPTVKPIKLMNYLCKLTKTPSGGVVLDPFMGSGTTGLACVNTGRDFIGIEKEKDYFQIAQRRINDLQNNRSK